MGREEEIRKATQMLFEAYSQLVGPHKASTLGVNEFLTLRDRAEEAVGFRYEMHAPPERGTTVPAPVWTPVQTEETQSELQREGPESGNKTVAARRVEEVQRTTPQGERRETKTAYNFPEEGNVPIEKDSSDRERMAIAILNAIEG